MSEVSAPYLPLGDEFVKELKARERSRVMRFWDMLKLWRLAQQEHGELLPVPMVAGLADVCRQRVHQLVEAGTLEVVYVNGHPMVTVKSLQAWLGSERRPGRPSLAEMAKRSWAGGKAAAQEIVPPKKKS